MGVVLELRGVDYECLDAPQREAVTARNRLDGEKADVVTVALIFGPGIAEPDEETHRPCPRAIPL